MKRTEQRRVRLLEDHIPAWEARQLSKLVKYPLASPAMKRIRSLRKLEWRQHKKAGLGKRSYNQRVGFFYEAEGLREKKKYQVPEFIGAIAQEPRIQRATEKQRRQYIIRVKSPATFTGRYNILKKHGFFDFEARVLAELKDIHPENRPSYFRSKVFQAMLRNHKGYLDRMVLKAMGRMKKQMGVQAFKAMSVRQRLREAKRMVKNLLYRHFLSDPSSPWEWLKREYRPKKHPKAYQRRQVGTAQRKTNRLMATEKQYRQQAPVFFD